MTHKITPTETKVFVKHEYEPDIMRVEREAYILERFPDTISSAPQEKSTFFKKLIYWVGEFLK